MKTYWYKAKKGPAEVVEGSLAAETQDQALDKIHELGLVPVDIHESSNPSASGQPAQKKSVFKSNSNKIKTREVAYFYRQLASLVKSGVPIVKGLHFLANENSNPHFQQVIRQIETAVREGEEPYVAFSRYPKAFTAFDRGMIQAGEKSGNLEEALTRIAQYRTDQEVFRAKVMSALTYPSFVAVIGIISMIFMMAFVVPKFTVFFDDLGQDLPLITRILIIVSDWMQWGWIVLLGFAAVAIFILKRMLSIAKTRIKIHAGMLKLPLIGNLLLKSETASLARSLALLMKSGIPILSAIKGTIPVLRNEALRVEMARVYQALEDGGYLSQGLAQSKLFPRYFVQIVGVGEESGKLEDSLNDLAAWYEFDSEEATRTMTNLLEPMIILIIGVVLGFMIMAVLLPIFSMSTSIS